MGCLDFNSLFNTIFRVYKFKILGQGGKIYMFMVDKGTQLFKKQQN